MTPSEFRQLALALPNAIESSHMEHPDFRVEGGRIFASLGYPTVDWAVVMLTPEDQAKFCAADPEIFSPVNGAWGRAGSTRILLKAAGKASVSAALCAAHASKSGQRSQKKVSSKKSPAENASPKKPSRSGRSR